LSAPRHVTLLALLLTAACVPSRPENQRAKARIFARVESIPPPPSARPIDLGLLPRSTEEQDRALEMDETEAFGRLGSFRLRATLKFRFTGQGQRFSETEERLVEQSSVGDLHLRMLEESGGGMEILSVGTAVYGRSRYGAFTERERDSGLAEQRNEVFGALKALYLESDRGWQLTEAGSSEAGGRPCRRFQLSAGRARPAKRPELLLGRLDPDTEKRSQFVQNRAVDAVHGTICFDDGTGVPTLANVQLAWIAGGDAGAGRVEADLEQALEEIGRPIGVQPPESFEPIPHRPKGPAMALTRFGFGPKPPDSGPEPSAEDEETKN
jgi:hypothetical protein